MLADGPQPFVGLLAHDPVRREEQVGVGPPAAATDPAAELVELAETEHVRPVDDKGVDSWHVDAGLDDRRADEDVETPLREVEHDLLEAAFVHLPVGDGDAGVRHEVADVAGDLLDVLHTVVDVEDLALPQELAPDGLGHGALVVLADVGEDRLAFDGRCVDEREVADAGQAQLEGARDRACREREHVHSGGDLLDGLLVADAEALLLVDDEQPELLEPDIGCKGTRCVPTTRSTEPSASPSTTFFASAAVKEPGQHLDPDRIGGVPVGERLEMLLCQQRRRHEHSGLITVLDGLEDRSHGHLGLPEADVATHEAVHRDGSLHVGLHVGNGAQLVRRLRVGERLLQLGLPRRVGRKGVAGLGGAPPVERHQLLRHFPDGGADAGFLFLPFVAAEAVERRVVAARVRRDRVDLIRRHVQLVPAAVLEQEVVALGAADGAAYKPAVAGDAVHVVHDVGPRGEVVEETLHRPRPRPRHPVRSPAPRDVGLRHERQLGVGQERSPIERHDDDVDARATQDLCGCAVVGTIALAGGGVISARIGEEMGVEALGRKDTRHAVGTAAAIRADDDAVA